MRTEEEMLALIIDTAKEDDRIRAVYMGGSRANPRAKRDMFQDYDIGYVVRETRTFVEDRAYPFRFGDILYMQRPEETTLYEESNKDESYGWLMQFEDGNRMDLHVVTPDSATSEWLSDHMYLVLLDKDGILPEQTESVDKHYWIQRPKEKTFLDTANEFWWCLNNVAKGLFRDEIPYTMQMIDAYIRPMLVNMLEWSVGFAHNFSVSIGKGAKYLKDFTDSNTYERFISTYSEARADKIWESVFTMCRLFDETAKKLAADLDFTYNSKEAEASYGFLKRVRALPPDAKTI